MRGFMIILLALLLCGVFSADAEEVKRLKEGESVTLHTGVTKQHDDKMLWYFNDIQITYINGDPNKNCLYDGEGGIFIGKLKVDNTTGSLTITDVRPEHAGRYEAELIKRSPGTSKSLNQNKTCESRDIIKKNIRPGESITFSVTVSGSGLPSAVPGLSAGAVAGIVVAVLLGFAVTAGVIYYRHRSSRREVEKKKPGLLLKV